MWKSRAIHGSFGSIRWRHDHEAADYLELEEPETLSCFHFPLANPASCLRLALSLLKEWHEDWITGHPWLGMELLFKLDAEGQRRPSDPPEDAA